MSEPIVPDLDFYFDRKRAADIRAAQALSASFGAELPLADQRAAPSGPSSEMSEDELARHLQAFVAVMAHFVVQYKSRGRGVQNAIAGFRRQWDAWVAFLNKPLPPPEPEPLEAVGIVYFIRTGGFVKIGYTTNLDSRIKSLSTSAAVAPVMLHSEPGTIRDERAYHRRFADLRANGEWFRLEGELQAYLAALAGGI